MGGRIGRDQRRWTARAGFALMLAGENDAAAATLLAVIAEPRGEDDVAQVVRRIADEGIPEDQPPAWYYNLGVCLYGQGDLSSALTLVRSACERHPEHVRWHRMLAKVASETGDLQTSTAVLQRLVELRSQDDPRPGHDLAAIYARAGQWDVAQRLLSKNVHQHPGHAPSHKLLAEAATSMNLWGGSFAGTLPVRADGNFSFIDDESRDDLSASPNALAVTELTRAVELKPARPQWRAALADARLAAGDIEGAIADYEAALRTAETTHDRWALGGKQRLQFHLERCHHLLGDGRVEDPIFDVEIKPTGRPATGVQQPAGFFMVRASYAGITISGFLGVADSEYVDVFMNGTRIRAVNVARDSFLPKFNLLIKRATVAQFPSRAKLEVRTHDRGKLLGPRGVPHIELLVPHGDGRLLEIVGNGGTLDKKGEIWPSPAEMRRRQDRDLEIYARVRDFFENHLGRPIFLLYGTLLGYYRDGDLIPGDDDFDAAYVSDGTDPLAVKEEAKGIITELVRAGFTVSFNRRGRLFRVQLDRNESNGSHVDVHTLWFQDGKVWIHNVVSMPSVREDFLPVADGTLRGVPVSIPGNAEAFLRGNYGPGWVTPDPGFRYYPSAVEPSVRRNLARALMTVGEYKELAERIRREVGDDPTAGRFVSIGSQNLYPLSEFLA